MSGNKVRSLKTAHKAIPLKLTLAVLLALTTNAPLVTKASSSPAARQRSQTPAAIEAPSTANRLMLGWLAAKENGARQWMNTRGQQNGIPDNLDYYLVEKDVPLLPMSSAESQIAVNTKALYDQYFPRNELSSYVGTFFESGNPHVSTVRGPYQWDSQLAAGLEEEGAFDAAVKRLVGAGIKSIRIGPNLFEVQKGAPRSWSKFLEKVETIWKNGGTPSISVAFFPSLERWKTLDANGNIDESKSYLLNPQWSSDLGAMTSDMMTLLNERAEIYEKSSGKQARFIINPINEPETLAGFNRQFWHGAFANWSSPVMMKYYVPSLINIGKANVAIRQAVENKSVGKRVLFMHNEAMTPLYYPSHKGPGRFAVSKFMLGDDVVMKTDFDALLQLPLNDLEKLVIAGATAKPVNEVHWAIKEFVFGTWNTTPEMKEDARAQLVKEFKNLKQAHRQLFASTGKTMKTDNMLWMDYYYQTEFVFNKPIPKLIQELGADHGALLKKVLDVKDDAAFLRMVRTAVAEAKKRVPHFPLMAENAKVDDINFSKLLAAEDTLLFDILIGARNEFDFAKDPVTKARRSHLPLFEERVDRTDELLAKVLADKAKVLRTILNAPSEKQLRAALSRVARDNRDGEGVIAFSGNETLREILTKNNRKVLERVFGMTRERFLGFEPNHYARQIRLGIRDGFYKFSMQYINSLRLHTVGVGESGTPFYVFAPLLHDQVMMEYAHVLKNGVYGTQYAFGPAVDTKGWAKGPMSLHFLDDNEINPSGLFSIVKEGAQIRLKDRGYDPEKPGWARAFLTDFFGHLKGN